MRVLTTIRVQKIEQIRKSRLNLKTLKFVIWLTCGKCFPPITVTPLCDGNFLLLEGHHRLAAYRLLGWERIQAYIGVAQEPDPHKPLAHAPDKPVVYSRQVAGLTPSPWLEL